MAGEVDHDGAVPVALGHGVEMIILGEDAGVADDDVDTAEFADGEIDGVLHRLVFGEVHHDADTADLLHDVRNVFVDVETDDLCALLGEGFRDGEADACGAAGDEGDFALMHLAGGAFAQFGLLQIPVFDLEDVLFRQRLPATDGFAKLHGGSGRFSDVGDDFGFLQSVAKADNAVVWPDGETGGGIEHGLPAGVALEVCCVFVCVLLNAGVEVCADEGGGAFGADAVIRGQGAASAEICHGSEIGISHGFRGRIEAGDLWETTAFGDGLAKFRQSHEVFGGCSCGCLGTFLGQVVFRHGHHLDVQFVAFAGVVIEGEEAVLEQDHALDAFLAQIAACDEVGDGFGQNEAGHHIGDDDDPIAIDLLHTGFAFGVAGEGGNGVRVAMIDKFEGQDGVQDRLNAGGRGVGVGHGRTLLQHHVLIAHGGEFGHLDQRLHAHGGEAGALDGGEIPAAAFDVAEIDRITEEVLLRDLD